MINFNDGNENYKIWQQKYKIRGKWSKLEVSKFHSQEVSNAKLHDIIEPYPNEEMIEMPMVSQSTFDSSFANHFRYNPKKKVF